MLVPRKMSNRDFLNNWYVNPIMIIDFNIFPILSEGTATRITKGIMNPLILLSTHPVRLNEVRKAVKIFSLVVFF